MSLKIPDGEQQALMPKKGVVYGNLVSGVLE